ncbi:hypothetical protein NAPIS_ORF02094 [Vairimorpha apis BRL 01]|uniref:Reverse transcriptase domain-containing protein n=1 Tax=Vairimorpha apis BRL 01 TaxID=1037528 RepID=T0KY78_9MICR|nr:hypothetical protein NAPIS_ORF02094 [Vairimorpha apis BRL 01]
MSLFILNKKFKYLKENNPYKFVDRLLALAFYIENKNNGFILSNGLNDNFKFIFDITILSAMIKDHKKHYCKCQRSIEIRRYKQKECDVTNKTIKLIRKLLKENVKYLWDNNKKFTLHHIDSDIGLCNIIINIIKRSHVEMSRYSMNCEIKCSINLVSWCLITSKKNHTKSYEYDKVRRFKKSPWSIKNVITRIYTTIIEKYINLNTMSIKNFLLKAFMKQFLGMETISNTLVYNNNKIDNKPCDTYIINRQSFKNLAKTLLSNVMIRLCMLNTKISDNCVTRTLPYQLPYSMCWNYSKFKIIHKNVMDLKINFIEYEKTMDTKYTLSEDNSYGSKWMRNQDKVLNIIKNNNKTLSIIETQSELFKKKQKLVSKLLQRHSCLHDQLEKISMINKRKMTKKDTYTGPKNKTISNTLVYNNNKIDNKPCDTYIINRQSFKNLAKTLLSNVMIHCVTRTLPYHLLSTKKQWTQIILYQKITSKRKCRAELWFKVNVKMIPTYKTFRTKSRTILELICDVSCIMMYSLTQDNELLFHRGRDRVKNLFKDEYIKDNIAIYQRRDFKQAFKIIDEKKEQEPKKTGDQEIGKSKSKFRRRIFNISVKLVKINVSRPRIHLLDKGASVSSKNKIAAITNEEEPKEDIQNLIDDIECRETIISSKYSDMLKDAKIYSRQEQANRKISICPKYKRSPKEHELIKEERAGTSNQYYSVRRKIKMSDFALTFEGLTKLPFHTNIQYRHHRHIKQHSTQRKTYNNNKNVFLVINVPFTFKRIINKYFTEYMYKFVTVYLDDILVIGHHTKDSLEAEQEEVLFITTKNTDKTKFENYRVNNSQHKENILAFSEFFSYFSKILLKHRHPKLSHRVPVIYTSTKLLKMEINYTITDKESLRIKMTVEFDGHNGSIPLKNQTHQRTHNVITDVLSRIILLLSEIIIEESDLFNSFRESVCVRRQAYSDYQNLKPWVCNLTSPLQVGDSLMALINPRLSTSETTLFCHEFK